MRRGIVGIAVLGVMGCASGGYPVVIGEPRPDVVVVRDDGHYDYERGKKGGKKGYRSLRVPRGHYPPPGACRVWYAGRPPGHQPPPMRCDRLYGRVPAGVFILYNDAAWDGDYDWDRYERRYRGSVPRVIVRISQSMRRY